MFDGHWWVADLWEQSPVLLISWVFWVIVSIVLHELSHGWAAIRCGDRTPMETGHMTWNPVVHMGQMSLLMFAVIGIAWGAMPVNPGRFRRRHDDALVSFAGPAMNLSLFVVSLLCAAVVLTNIARLGEPMGRNLFMFLFAGAYLNVALMVLNLLPVPPLDGSRILASFFPPFRHLWTGERAQVVAVIAFIAVFLFAGDFVFGVAQAVTERALHGLLALTGHPIG